jgi:hypothetical protein
MSRQNRNVTFDIGWRVSEVQTIKRGFESKLKEPKPDVRLLGDTKLIQVNEIIRNSLTVINIYHREI